MPTRLWLWTPGTASTRQRSITQVVQCQTSHIMCWWPPRSTKNDRKKKTETLAKRCKNIWWSKWSWRARGGPRWTRRTRDTCAGRLRNARRSRRNLPRNRRKINLDEWRKRKRTTRVMPLLLWLLAPNARARSDPVLTRCEQRHILFRM